MALDGIVLNSIKHELVNKLIGGRVDKVYQPEKDEIIINIRNNSSNYKLLLTSNSSSPRIHLTTLSRKNPEQAPMFCMLLRKHLYSSNIIEIKQLQLDRVIEIVFECKDELKTTVKKSLIIEIMGKHSNIIFINYDNKTIIDSIKRVSENMSSVRQVYPGIPYALPPSQSKLNPLDIDKDGFINAINATNKGTLIFGFLYKTFIGFSPLLSKEICFNSGVNEGLALDELSENDINIIYENFNNITNNIKNNNYTPAIYSNSNENIYDFHSIKINYFNNCEKQDFNSISELLDVFYYELDNKNRINQKVSNLLKSINTKLDRDRKKLEKQKNELLSAEDREKYKIYGDLIISNLHVPYENNKLIVINYYDPEQNEITIPLDPKLNNLTLNSQKYYKRYNKLKSAEDELLKLIESTASDIEYLENILFSIEACQTTDDLDQIYEELSQEGFIKKYKAPKGSNKVKNDNLIYISSYGHEILVGKNNIQNDLITFKHAKKDDYWFHAKGIPGSHVVIKTNGDELEDIEYMEAAKLAAFYSKGKKNSLVEVDYTKRQNIRKPANAKLGFVIYDTNYSMNIDTDISKIKIKE
ncbi:MAG TPA: fibronectin/fibrinogen-binding protein [Clostridiales bacterium]|nr:fibronectin/fibrinogen-binding protein [Clostridiales bacterium]